MKLQDANYDNGETGCCSLIDPSQWDNREFVWENKLFIKDHIIAFFHLPLNFGGVAGRVMKKIEEAEAFPADPFWICDETSLWGSDFYVAVDKEVPNTEMQSLSGTFISKVFEGPYRNMSSWIKKINRHVQSKGKTVQKLYFYYTVCPKCAKHYGKNYVVIIAQV